ncbi:hypothetical protein [Flavobacterium johnsoniae]|uniref:hypothetical protein n=1 Tax=Flavobacterium johnsoniae TaxID=986 RepID=UPI003D95DE4B
MKKTALTFGLFSLVVVATSFANPVSTNTSADKSIEISFDTDGRGQTGGNRKHDEFIGNQELLLKNNQSSFAAINQSLGANKKLD